MTWYYSENPATSDKDAVRYHIGDTDKSEKLLQDEEINYLLAQKGSVLAASAQACRDIAARFARKYDQSVGGVKYSYKQRFENYTKLADELQKKSNKLGGVPYVGGISRSEKKAVESDTDRVKPAFTRDLFDIPSANPLTDDDE